MSVARTLPGELVHALDRIRELETSAATRGQCRNVIAASGALMLAGVNEGWRVAEMAKILDVDRQAASKRVAAARARYADGHPGIEVPSSPAKLRAEMARSVLDTPLADREWLTIGEAAKFVSMSPSSIRNWLSAGMLPNTERGTRRNLYLRADLQRVRNAERYNRGANRRELLERIRHASG